MLSHWIRVTIVEKNGASPGDKMKISTFIHLQKKIVFDSRFALEGNSLTFPVAYIYCEVREQFIE